MPLFSGNIKKIVDESERNIVNYLNKHPRLDVNEPVFPESKDQKENMLGVAAKKGYVEAVTVLLSRGADVNAINWLSETALHHASHGGYPAMIDVLLRQPDIDLNNQTVHGCSALHLAAAAKQDHILAQLLEVEGINANLVDKFGNTVLHHAIGLGNSACVELLLGYPKLQINVQNEKGETPLHFAAECGDVNRLTPLLTMPAIKLNVYDARGRTPLDIAEDPKIRFTAGAALLRNPPAKKRPVPKFKSTLKSVVDASEDDILTYLQENPHCDVNVEVNDNRESMLIVASRKGYERALCLLLAKHADISHTSARNFRNALHVAAGNGKTNIVCQLLDHPSTQVNLGDAGRWTALHFAAYWGEAEVVPLLLSQPRIDVGVEQEDGKNALAIARERGNLNVVSMLTATPQDQQKMISHAISYRQGVASAMKEYMRHPYPSDMEAIAEAERAVEAERAAKEARRASISMQHKEPALEGEAAILDKLEKHADTDFDSIEVNADRDTMLALCVAKDYETAVSVLLSRGCNVNRQNKNGVTPLHFAASLGRTNVATQLLARKDVNVNLQGLGGRTALHDAAVNGHLDIVLLLLSHPATNISITNSTGATALQLAVARGHVDVIKVLQDAAAKIVFRDGSEAEIVAYLKTHNTCDLQQKLNAARDTVVIVCATKGYVNAITQLVARDVDTNYKNSRGSTALHFGAYYGHLQIVSRLMSAEGNDVNIAKSDGMTPLHFASKEGHVAIVEQLSSAADIQMNPQDSVDGLTPLHQAVYFNRIDVVRALLKQGGTDATVRNKRGHTALDIAMNKAGIDADIVSMLQNESAKELLRDGGESQIIAFCKTHPSYDFNGELNAEKDTALIISATKGFLKAVSILLGKKADPNKKNSRGSTALHFASYYGHTSVVTKLLSAQYNTNVNAQKKDGMTPLHFATKEGHTAVVEQFIVHPDIDVNKRDSKQDYTALHYAAYFNRWDIVRLLLAHPKIDVSLRSNTEKGAGRTALQIAEGRNASDAAALISAFVPDNISAVSAAGEDDIVQYLLEHPECDVNLNVNGEGDSMLIIAAKKGFHRAVVELLNREAKVNHANRRGSTALHYAVFYDNQEVCRALLAHPVIDVTLRNINGCTAMYFAAQEGRTYLAKKLMELREDALLSIMDKNNMTPLHVASYNGRTGMVEELLQHAAIDFHALNGDGKTALQLAEIKGNVGAAELLKAAAAKETEEEEMQKQQQEKEAATAAAASAAASLLLQQKHDEEETAAVAAFMAAEANAAAAVHAMQDADHMAFDAAAEESAAVEAAELATATSTLASDSASDSLAYNDNSNASASAPEVAAILTASASAVASGGGGGEGADISTMSADSSFTEDGDSYSNSLKSATNSFKALTPIQNSSSRNSNNKYEIASSTAAAAKTDGPAVPATDVDVDVDVESCGSSSHMVTRVITSPATSQQIDGRATATATATVVSPSVANSAGDSENAAVAPAAVGSGSSSNFPAEMTRQRSATKEELIALRKEKDEQAEQLKVLMERMKELEMRTATPPPPAAVPTAATVSVHLAASDSATTANAAATTTTTTTTAAALVGKLLPEPPTEYVAAATTFSNTNTATTASTAAATAAAAAGLTQSEDVQPQKQLEEV